MIIRVMKRTEMTFRAGPTAFLIHGPMEGVDPATPMAMRRQTKPTALDAFRYRDPGGAVSACFPVETLAHRATIIASTPQF